MAQLIEINQVGKREDLRDIISLADVRNRPFMAMAPKIAGARNMLVEWQVDKYDTPVTTNKVADGVDVTSFENKAKNRYRLGNYSQKFRKSWMVGDEAENVSDVAGVSSEAALALDKCIEEIGRDIEYTLCSNNGAVLETGEANPYQLRALGKWLQDGTTRTSHDTVLPFSTSGYLIPTASVDSNATITEANLGTVLASIYSQWGKGGVSLTAIVGPTLKKTISGFTQYSGSTTTANTSIRSFNASLDGKKITANITRYEGDFNSVDLVPSLLLPSAVYGYVIPWDYVAISFNRQARSKPLPDMGGGPRGYVDAILTLVVKNPTVFGVFEG